MSNIELVTREVIEQALHALRHPSQADGLHNLAVQRERKARHGNVNIVNANTVNTNTMVGNSPNKAVSAPSLIEEALATLAHEDKQLCDLLLWHYRDNETMWAIANRLAVQERTAYTRKSAAITRLTEIVTWWEAEARQRLQQRWQTRLEAPTYQTLYGVADQVERVAATLRKTTAPWLISVEGIGGIGKTALADQLARSAIHPSDWDELAWVTARQRVLNLGGALRDLPYPALTVEALVDALNSQLLADEAVPQEVPLAQKLNALRKRCREARCLIVIDNLETVADVDTLLDTLIDLSNPSKILITSRHQVAATSGVYTVHPPALSKIDALALLRSEAELRNLPHLIEADAATLQRVYQVVGGHPLALRLVVGQTYLYPLETVLENLRGARGDAAQNLYHYIYRQSWENLDVVARHLLLMLLTAPERGATLDFLTQLIAAPNLLPPPGLAAWTHYDLLRGLETLVRLNLVDRRGDLHASHYTLHSLTRAFLHEQVLQW